MPMRATTTTPTTTPAATPALFTPPPESELVTVDTEGAEELDVGAVRLAAKTGEVSDVEDEELEDEVDEAEEEEDEDEGAGSSSGSASRPVMYTEIKSPNRVPHVSLP